MLGIEVGTEANAAPKSLIAAAVPDDDVVLFEIRLQIHAGMDLVHHQGEVDGLVGQGLVCRHGGGGPGGEIGVAGVVADHAIGRVVAQAAVQLQIDWHSLQLASATTVRRGVTGAVHREIDHLVDRRLLAVCWRRARQQGDAHAALRCRWRKCPWPRPERRG